MDIKKIKKYQIWAVLFTIIVGSLLHFSYDWSGNSNIVALYSAVNESTWEHLKLIFFPMLIFAIIQYFLLGNNKNNYIEAKYIGVLAGMLFIVTAFYTYTGVIGSTYFLIDILIFILAVIIAEYIAYKIMLKPDITNRFTQVLSILCIILIAIMFFVYTFIPPQIGLFLDPITNTYGIPMI